MLNSSNTVHHDKRAILLRNFVALRLVMICLTLGILLPHEAILLRNKVSDQIYFLQLAR